MKIGVSWCDIAGSFEACCMETTKSKVYYLFDHTATWLHCPPLLALLNWAINLSDPCTTIPKTGGSRAHFHDAWHVMLTTRWRGRKILFREQKRNCSVCIFFPFCGRVRRWIYTFRQREKAVGRMYKYGISNMVHWPFSFASIRFFIYSGIFSSFFSLITLFSFASTYI